MDIFSRAVDWVVTRTAQEEPLHIDTSYSHGASTWENLPEDIFCVILKNLESKADGQTIGHMRLVCKTWRRQVERHLEWLSLTVSNTEDVLPLLHNFSNLRSLDICCTYNAEIDPLPILENAGTLLQLRKLDLRNSKGKLNDGLSRLLARMNNLTELLLDGDTFVSMRLANVTLPQLTTLYLQNCASFNSADYFFLTSFPHLNSLKLINASSFWKYGEECLSELNQLRELAIINYNANIAKPSFACLGRVSQLTQLAIQEADLRVEQIEDFPCFRNLTRLSLYGCSEISVRMFNCLGDRCPIVNHMKIGCFLDSAMEQDFNRMMGLACLERLEIINCPNLDTRLFEACFQNDVEMVHEPLPDTLLHEKSKLLDYRTLEHFLKSRQEYEISGLPLFGEFFDPSVLTELSAKARFDLVQLLVSYGADVDYGNPFLAHDSCHCYDCSTPLHFAVHRGDTKGVVDLLNLGARVNAHCSEDYRVPLHLAASSGNLELTKILLAAGGAVNALDSLFRTPLHAAVSWGSKPVISELIKHGADGTFVDHELLSPLCYAARSADVDLLSFLIEAGLKVNEGMKYDLPTPLHVAVKRGKMKMVKFLLENGAKAEARDVSGSSTPLFVAARHGHQALLAMLLRSANPDNEVLNARDETGNTLLHYSAMHGWIDIVELLIEMGVDVNGTDPKGFTALYYADMQRHMKIVSRLTREGGLARWITQPRIYRRQNRLRIARPTALW